METRHTTTRSTGDSAVCCAWGSFTVWEVCVAAALTLLPEDLWLRARVGRFGSGKLRKRQNQQQHYALLRRDGHEKPSECPQNASCRSSSERAQYRRSMYNWAVREDARESARSAHCGGHLLRGQPCCLARRSPGLGGHRHVPGGGVRFMEARRSKAR